MRRATRTGGFRVQRLAAAFMFGLQLCDPVSAESERRCGQAGNGSNWVDLDEAANCVPANPDCNDSNGSYAYNPNVNSEDFAMFPINDFALPNACRITRVLVRYHIRYDYDCDGQNRRVTRRVRVPSAGIDEEALSAQFSQSNNDGDCHWIPQAEWDITNLTDWTIGKLNDLRVGIAPVRRANEPCGGSTSWLRCKGVEVIVEFDTYHAPLIAEIGDGVATCGGSYAGPLPALDDPTCTGPVSWSLVTAPAGASINPNNGQVAWNSARPGAHTFTIQAAGAVGTPDQESWVVNVAYSAPDVAPIDTLPATCGAAYTSSPPVIRNPVCAGVVTWTLTQAPSGMSINTQSGAVSWPSPVPGSHAVTIRANNSITHVDESFSVQVARVIPAIAAIPDGEIAQRRPYAGPLPTLTNAGCAAPVTWTLIQGPAGMTIDPATGRVQWQNPLPADAPYLVIIRARNEAGPDDEDWHLTVSDECPVSGCDAADSDVDLDDDCDVDLDDLSLLLSAFGGQGGPADVNGDGSVNLGDLSLLLSRFGLVCY